MVPHHRQHRRPGRPSGSSCSRVSSGNIKGSPSGGCPLLQTARGLQQGARRCIRLMTSPSYGERPSSTLGGGSDASFIEVTHSVHMSRLRNTLHRVRLASMPQIMRPLRLRNPSHTVRSVGVHRRASPRRADLRYGHSRDVTRMRRRWPPDDRLGDLPDRESGQQAVLTDRAA
jgi:hypothetical protein